MSATHPIEQQTMVTALIKALTDGVTGSSEWATPNEIKLRLSHAGITLQKPALMGWLTHLEQAGKVERRGDAYRLKSSNPAMEEASTTRQEQHRLGAPIQSRRTGHDSTLELHREIQRLKDKINMETEQPDRQLAEVHPADPVVAAPQMSIEELLERDEFIRQVVTEVFKPGVDYGPPFPGATDNALWQSGANKLTTLFGLFADFIEVEKVIERAPDSVATQHIRYEYRCNLHAGSRNGPVVGTAIGICSTEEEKYKYRLKAYVCPSCGQETIIKGKAGYGGGWLCYRKKGGCGAKYNSGDVTIEHQETGRIVNPDMMGLQHTIAAMAQKRAFILAVRRTTGVDSYFSELVADDEPTARPATINGTTTTQNSAAAWSSRLIKYAETLLPADHGYSRSEIGAACLRALGLENWSSPYNGTEDTAKSAIAAALNKKMGNTDGGEEFRNTISNSPELKDRVSNVAKSKKQAASNDNLCLKCSSTPALSDDSPFPFLCAKCANEAANETASE